ncbi:unnamed protein product [Lymnaea stagnalis]|uniref:Uncharacterized protein n=1 Tax=Lymnaea stagnalis TaxID=6523 RepID=A0AAV2I5M8_LYMST
MKLVRVYVIILCAYFSTTTAQKCRTLDIRSCEHYAMIAFPKLHAFFSEETFPNYCSYLGLALQCAQNHLKLCSDMDKIPFSISYEVENIVCKERKEEHRNSSKCLTRPAINQQIIGSCLSVYKCGDIDKGIKCAMEYVSTIDGCTAIDVTFIGDLAQAYLRPIKSLLKCKTTNIGYELTTKPPALYKTTLETNQTRSSVVDSRSTNENGSTHENSPSVAYNPQTIGREEPTEPPQESDPPDAISTFVFTSGTTDSEKSADRPTTDLFERPSYNARTLEHTRRESSHRNRAGRYGINFCCLMSLGLYRVIL